MSAANTYAASKNSSYKGEMYIHYNPSSYKHPDNYEVTETMIRTAYKKQAVALESAAMADFRTMGKREFNRIIKAEKELLQDAYTDTAFSKINKTLEESLGAATGVSANPLTAIKGIKKAQEALQDSATLLNSINELTDTVSDIDSLLLDYIKSQGEDRSSLNINKGKYAILGSSGVAEAAKHMRHIEKIQTSLKAGDTSIEKAVSQLSADITKAKGGMGEIAQAMFDKGFSDALKKQGVAGVEIEFTGELKSYVDTADKRWDTISATSRSLKSRYGGFRAKSDYVKTLFEIDESGNYVKMGVIGKSSKSYPSTKASGAALVANSPWANVFTFADLIDTKFEYYYANSAIFEPSVVQSNTSILNRYLAAKAATFITTGPLGVAGLTPAIFLQYTDKAIYLPDVYKEIAKGTSPELKISATKFPNKTDNAFVDVKKKGKDTPEDAAYRRSKKLLSKLRSGVKFTGKK